jgi:hypothetical protein
VYEAYYSPYLRGTSNLQQNKEQILQLQAQHQTIAPAADIQSL